MASLKNGYARIANELLEAIATAKITPMQREIAIIVMRYTYGYNGREFAELSYSFLADGLGHDRRETIRQVDDLIEKRILMSKTGTRITTLGINDHVEQWLVKFLGSGLHTTTNSGEITTKDSGEITTTNSGEITTQQIQNEKKKNPNTNTKGEFEDLWALYPRKLGKSAVHKKAKEDVERNADDVRKAIAAYCAEIERQHTEERYIMYGSTFFNGRWRDYLGAAEDAEEQTKSKFGRTLE